MSCLKRLGVSATTWTTRPRLAAGCCLALSLAGRAWADDTSGAGRELEGRYQVQDVRLDRAIKYATFGRDWLSLDLFRPEAGQCPYPLIVFVHGGAWMDGLRFDIPPEIIAFTARGYAVATIDYRLSRYERFPANVHDVKAAVRFLRANAPRLDCDPQRIAIVGLAAGGHLAALAGLASGELEGTVGNHDDVSSVPQAIVSIHGPTNIRTILVQKTPGGTGRHRPAVELMLGGPPETRSAKAMLASPVEHVHKAAPPLLIIHGDADDQVPVSQAMEMQSAYRRHEARVEMVVVKGANHRAARRFDAERIATIEDFLARHLAERRAQTESPSP